MILEKYPSYKDSGVEWLGKIPENWEVKRIKEISQIKGRIGYRGYTKEDLVAKGEGAIVLGAGEINEKGYTQLEKTQYLSWAKYYESPEIMLKVNHILIVQRGSTIGKVGLINKNIGKATINPTMAIIKNIKINPKFLLYNLMSIRVQNFIKSQKYSTAIPMISQDNIGNYIIFNISNNLQEKIVVYLDKKTSLIDQKINILQDKKISYEELKKTLINETVCRGVNKDVELKEANANWVGEIPSHWNVERLKNIFEERVEKNLNLEDLPITTNILSVMKDIGVINHRDKGNVGNKMSEDITGYKLVYPKDIVVNKMNVLIGSVGISKEFGALSVIYIILKTKSKNCPEYYDYVFRSKYFQKYLRTISTGILEIRECVNSNLFRHQEIPQPPKQEQIQIAKYLGEKTSKIDEIISKLKDQITTLTEFRKTLINDVVTGKVRVQNE